MPKKMTIDNVKNKVNKKSKHRWLVLSTNYINNRYPLRMLYKPLNKIYKVSFSNFMRSKKYWDKGHKTREYAKKVYKNTNGKWKLENGCDYKNRHTAIRLIYLGKKHYGRVRSVLPSYLTSIKYKLQPVTKENLSVDDIAKKVYKITKHQWKLDKKFGYHGNNKPIKVIHIKCGKSRKVVPKDLFYNNGKLQCFYCKELAGNINNDKMRERKLLKYKERMNKYPNLSCFRLVDMYHKRDNYNILIILNCNRCGHYLVTNVHSLFSHHPLFKCKYCNKYCQNAHDFSVECFDNIGCSCTPISNFKGNKHKVLLHCNKCGLNFFMYPSHLIHHKYIWTPCKKCRKIISIRQDRISDSKIKNRVKQITNCKYKVIGKTRGTHHKAKFYHYKCHHTFLMTPKAFFSGTRCPFCASSHGEECISYWLDAHKLKYQYIHGYHLHNTKNTLRRLHLDFYLPNIKIPKFKNGIGIEYDGSQHREVNYFFDGVIGYKKRHKHDLEKNKYCPKHHIKLIRIPAPKKEYYKNIKEQVNKYLNKFLLPYLKN